MHEIADGSDGVLALQESFGRDGQAQTVGRGSARLLRKVFFDGIASRSLLSLGRFSDAKV